MGSSAGLTAVTGPAGSGKTMLASGWARAGMSPGPVAWLTLDDEDNAPGVFWSYVLHALRHGVPGLCRGIQAPTRPHAVGRSVVARLATAFEEHPGSVVLVLDRTELITNPTIAADLDMLVRYSTPALRLVLVGRSVRLLPLQRYRLTGQLSEIGTDDLALTPEEVVEILERHVVKLNDADARALHEGTEGWMTGVCLHALALQPHRSGSPGYPHPGGQQAIAEFLRSEVLNALPARALDVLLRTSIAEHVHPDLADRLTGRNDGHSILDELVRANAFVRPLRNSQLRCHPLFRQVLDDELNARHPELVRRLHGHAARWYAEHNLPSEALRHAVKFGDWPYAAALAVTRLGVAWLLTAPDAEPVWSILADLPETESGALVDVLRSVLALVRFDTVAAQTAVERAETTAALEPEAQSISLRMDTCTVRVILARMSGDVNSAERGAAEFDRLWSRLPVEDLPDQAGNRALILASLGAMQFWAGRFPEARATLGRTVVTNEPGTEYGVHDALAHLALLEVYEGRLRRADRYARESLAVAERAGLCPSRRVGAANAALAAAALLRSDLPAVREHLSRVIVAASYIHDPPTATAVALLRARIAIGRLDGRRALAAIEAARTNATRWHGSTVVRDMIETAAAGAHLALGDHVSARVCLDSVSDQPERTLTLGMLHLMDGDREGARKALSTLPARGARTTILLHASLALGRIAFAEGDRSAAVEALGRALHYGRPEQMRLPFIETGPWARQLLRQQPDLFAEHSWLSPGTGSMERATGGSPVVEPLTERETEVLGRLAEAMSTEDIANALYLSVNTVKTHLKSIYRKLGTSGRSAAAQRARELNLLPTSVPDKR
jgi:LuxR family maltose regulon positive regulatory protein